jgi:hypothetical protein
MLFTLITLARAEITSLIAVGAPIILPSSTYMKTNEKGLPSGAFFIKIKGLDLLG